MLTKKQLESLLSLAMKSQADFAEIFEEETHTESISIVNDDVEDINRAVRAGAGIRLYKGTSSVYGYTNEMDMSSLEEIVNDLRNAIGEKADGPTIVLNEKEMAQNISPVEIDPFATDDEVKIGMIREAIDAARDADERVFKVSAGLASSHQEVQIANTEGLFRGDVRQRSRMRASAFAKEGTNVQSGSSAPGASQGLEYFTGQHAPEKTGREAARVAGVLLKAKKAPSGVMPVIIDNGFGGVIFHEACGHSLEATGVAKNQSVLPAGKASRLPA